MGQQSPRAAAANRVTDPIHDLAPRVLGRAPAGLGRGHEQLQAIPLRISEIRIVGLPVFHLDRLGGRLFKRALRLPVVYGSGSEITGQRYNQFTEILLDKYRP